MKKPFNPNADYQPESFEFSKANAKLVDEIIARYPAGKQKSAVMPLLDLAQRQTGWIPRAAMDVIAEIINVPRVKVYEVASFYSMYNTAPVGKYLVQFCATTPCALCGSGEIVKACKEYLGIDSGETTEDGLFTLVEVECLGACSKAPVMQVNDDMYENLTPDSMRKALASLAKSKGI